MTESTPIPLLDAVVAEIEAHVATGGWDQSPALFALVPTRLVLAEPGGADLLGLDPGAEVPEQSLTPVGQDALPDSDLDEALAGIEWPEPVAGCALTQEIVILPPEAEQEVTAATDAGSQADVVAAAAAHPDRREARLVVGVLRDGRTASVLRLRAPQAEDGSRDDTADEIAFGADLAPNLVTALRATLEQ